MRHDLPLRRVLLIAGLSIFPAGARAQYYGDNFRDIRWLGRGNTGVAVIDDGTALFYNPAGLGFNNSYVATVANPSIAANENIYSSIKQLTGLTSGSQTLSDKFAPFLGKSLGASGSFFPNILVPNFAIGFWDYADTSILYRNPVYPELDVNARNDYGFIMGGGYAIQKYLSIGASIRYQRRRYLGQTETAGDLLSLTASSLENLMQYGEGWGVNLGVQSHYDIDGSQWIAAGLAIEDVGSTAFRNSTGATPPVQQEEQVNIGGAYGFKSTLIDWTLLADVKQLQLTNISYSKRVYLGAEASFLKIDLRGGFFQGYWTAGLSFRALPFLDIDFTTYGEEAASAAGIIQNRMFLLGLKIAIGITGDSSSGSGAGAKSGRRYRSQLDALY